MDKSLFLISLALFFVLACPDIVSTVKVNVEIA